MTALDVLAILADGVVLLCGLGFAARPGPVAAGRLLGVLVVLSALGAATACARGGYETIGLPVVGVVAVVTGLAVRALFRPPAVLVGLEAGIEAGIEAGPAAGSWPRFVETMPPPSVRVSGGWAMARDLPGLVMPLLAALAVAGTLQEMGPETGPEMGPAAAHPVRVTLAIGFSALLGGLVGASRADAPGRVRVAGVVAALEVLAWLAVRILPPADLLCVAGLPSCLLVLLVLAMRAMSASLRDWLDGAAPPEPGV